MSDPSCYSYSSCVALSIGMLIHNIDMKMGVQGGLVTYLRVPRYIKVSLLSEDIIQQYLLPACNDLKSALVSNQHVQPSLNPISSSAPPPLSNTKDSGAASTAANAGQLL